MSIPLTLTAPLELKGRVRDRVRPPNLTPITDEDALAALVTRQPFQTMAQRPSKPSDVTNIMLIGTLEQVQQAFKDAGWSNAAALTTRGQAGNLPRHRRAARL